MRRISFEKKGIRILGISESFDRERSQSSILAGVIMRRDGEIDGIKTIQVPLSQIELTNDLLEMYAELNRKDISAIIIQGCIISWFSIINIKKIASNLEIPVICVSYEDSEGLTKYFEEYFPTDAARRVLLYKTICRRYPVQLKTGYQAFLSSAGLTRLEAVQLLNMFLHQGRVIEPLRVANLIARAVFTQLHPKPIN